MHISIRQPQDLEQLRDKIRQESNSKQRDRYRAVLLALEGLLTNTIMQMLGRSKNFVQRWSYSAIECTKTINIFLRPARRLGIESRNNGLPRSALQNGSRTRINQIRIKGAFLSYPREKSVIILENEDRPPIFENKNRG